MMKIKPKQIIVALDLNSFNEVKDAIAYLDPNKFRIKVGKQLFISQGPQILDFIHEKGFDIFLDLKLHDIPNTVSKALLNIFKKKIWMTNIHLLGGEKMSRAAIEAKKDFDSILVGVTILTSLDEKFLLEMGIKKSLNDVVLKLAGDANKIGLDGVVCAVKDVKTIKQKFKNIITVTPGIRMKVIDDDQIRTSSLKSALDAKSDFMVLGREITEAKNKSEMIAELESYII